MAYPPGSVTVGREAIRKLFEQFLAKAPRFEPEPPLPTLMSGELTPAEALAAAAASLNDADQVTNGRRLNSEAKTFVTTELDKLGFKSIPSQANFIMFDCKRPVVPLIQAMKQRKVEVGRLFPAMPNHMRLTIGKKTEMEAFLAAFRQMAA